jgi:hypothetical protein
MVTPRSRASVLHALDRVGDHLRDVDAGMGGAGAPELMPAKLHHALDHVAQASTLRLNQRARSA